jgi:transposase
MTSEMLIGIDVAKDELVIDSGQTLVAIANTAEAIDAWLKTLPTVSYIGLEATGAYHQLLADRAVAIGKIVYVLNPRDMRHYALGLGRRGKTDRVDAQMIRRLSPLNGVIYAPTNPPRQCSMNWHYCNGVERRLLNIGKHCKKPCAVLMNWQSHSMKPYLL